VRKSVNYGQKSFITLAPGVTFRTLVRLALDAPANVRLGGKVSYEGKKSFITPAQVSTDEEDELEDTISPLGGEMSFDELSQKIRVSPRLEHRLLQRSASAGQKKVFEPRNSRSGPNVIKLFSFVIYEFS
jgi:hypothetical protein